MAGAAHTSGHYSVAWRQDEGHWLPAMASASDSELVCGWRPASELVEELAGRSLRDTRPAEPGHCLQVTDAEKEVAESLGHVLDHHQVER